LIYLLPIISAFIGWLTNYLAVKMLFHPKVERNFLGIKVQGIFPKRQQAFAQKLGILVSDELLSFEDISSQINSPKTQEEVLPIIDEKIDDFLNNKLGKQIPMLSMFLGKESVAKIKATLMNEFQDSLPEILERLSSSIQKDLDIHSLVVEKVSNFSSDKLEEILYGIMKKEFRFIEILGAVLGCIIGCVQLAIISFT